MTIDDTTPPQPLFIHERYLEIAVPGASFGATLAGILVWQLGYEISFQFFAVGCLIASCLLAYLAWIRPKKDIVALSTPIYGVIFFVVPTEYTVGVIMQLVYAVSLTILLIRLKVRFGKPGTAASMGKKLAGPLQDYVDQTRDAFAGIHPESAHEAAVAFVQFTNGEYRHAAQRAGAAAVRFTGDGALNPALVRAFAILREHAVLIDKSESRPVVYEVFRPEDSALLAHPHPPAYDDDREFYAALDNALLLLFSIAWNYAEADRPHLLACQAFLLKLLE